MAMYICSASTLAPVMACCLTAPIHNLNQRSPSINEVLWHLSESNFTSSVQATILYTRFENCICLSLLPHLPKKLKTPVNSPHKGLWRGALMFSLICAWINGWVNNLEAGDLRRHSTHYDVTVMMCSSGHRPPVSGTQGRHTPGWPHSGSHGLRGQPAAQGNHLQQVRHLRDRLWSRQNY